MNRPPQDKGKLLAMEPQRIRQFVITYTPANGPNQRKIPLVKKMLHTTLQQNSVEDDGQTKGVFDLGEDNLLIMMNGKDL